MNKLITIFFVLSVISANAQQKIAIKDRVKSFAMGFAVGQGALNEMPDATKCVTNSQPLVKQIETVIEDIKSHDIKNLVEFVETVEQIGKQFATIGMSCVKLSVEGKAFFRNILNHFHDKSLRNQGFLNILSNINKVAEDVQTGVLKIKGAQQETDYMVAGSKFGDIIKIFVNGANQNQMTEQLYVAQNTTKISFLTKAKDFVMGLSIGLGALNAMPDATACVTDLGTLQNEFKALLEEIKEHPTKILDTFELIKTFFKHFNADLPICNKLKGESKVFFENLANHFTNHTLRIQGFVNLGNNFEKVEENIKAAVHSLKIAQQETDYLVAGSKFGATINIFVNGGNSSNIINFLELASNKTNSTVATKVEHLLMGVVFGSKALSRMPHALNCVQDLSKLKDEITKLNIDLKNKSVVEALEIVGKLIKELRPNLETCLATQDEVDALGADVLESFTNKTRVEAGIKYLLIHAKDVSKAIELINASILKGKDADFQKAGFQLGNLLDKYVHGDKKQAEQKFLGQ